jgi:glycosyltransferase involved in cell wall biosynthesis
MAKLCWNAIVKNEAARIERCMASIAPYISCYVVVDTGSTDDTPQIIRKFFKHLNIPGKVHTAPFKDFSQARNAALSYAILHPEYKYDYLLLMDADMELVVEDPKFRDNLTAPSYDIVQRAGSLSYMNRRLLRRDQKGSYRGVTHEYLDVAAGGTLDGVYFIDHADGDNRPGKFKRDIALLEQATKDEPNNERSWFYLAQSYRDDGQHQKAADAYLKRANMGGWDEEAWNARVNYAHCLRNLGNEAGFVSELLTAYNQRPTRAESIYDLAKHYREKGMNHASLLLSEPGMAIPYPKDMLFVSDHVYATGLREEFSISAFYDPARRERGFAVCNALALDPKAYSSVRELARSNLFHYLTPLSTYVPSWRSQQIKFTPPDGYTAMNPSITTHAGQLCTTARTVNYTMDEQGRYLIKAGDGSITNDNPIHTRNFLLVLRDDLSVKAAKEILPPVDMPPPAFPLVVGFEDMRLFPWKGGLWCSSTVRETNPEGWCEQVLARVGCGPLDCRLDSWGRMGPETKDHQKNWMPSPHTGSYMLEFVHRLGKMVDEKGKVTYEKPLTLAADHMSGGTQLVIFRGGWLALVHECRHRPDNGKRYYQHRFVMFNTKHEVSRISLPFVFHDKQIEFAAGLAVSSDEKKLYISYGVRDCEAWIATVDANEVGLFLWAH